MHTVEQSETGTVETVEGVHLAQLAAGEHMSVQHYHFEPGSGVPEHDHHHEQVGFVYRGALTFVIPDGDGGEEEFVITAGESYALPGGEPHEAVNRGDEPAVGIDVFSPPRAQPPWEE